MTDETPNVPQPNSEEHPAAAPMTSALAGMSGETMVMIAGAIVIGVWVLFGLILNEWFPPYVAIIAGALAVAVHRAGPMPIGSGLSSSTVMKGLGWVLVTSGIFDFVDDIRFGWGEAVDVVASLILLGATVVAFFGTRSIQT